MAICILGISLVGLLALFTHCVFLANRAKNLTTATSHLEYVLEKIRQDPDSITTTDWPRWAEGQGLNTLQLESVSVSNTFTDPVYDVDVTVSWRDKTGDQSISISTRIYSD